MSRERVSAGFESKFEVYVELFPGHGRVLGFGLTNKTMNTRWGLPFDNPFFMKFARKCGSCGSQVVLVDHSDTGSRDFRSRGTVVSVAERKEIRVGFTGSRR